MTLASSGSITLAAVNTELNYTSTAPLTMNDARLRQLTNTSSGSSVNMNSMHGKYYNWIQALISTSVPSFCSTAINPNNKDIYVSHAGTVPSTGKDVHARYDSRGVIQWQKSYVPNDGPGGPSGTSGISASTADSNGNYYVIYYDTGYIWSSGNKQNVTRLGKVNSSGTLQWSRLLSADGSSNIGTMRLQGIIVDGSGNVYIAGAFQQSTSPYTQGLAVFKYDSSGTLSWQKRIDTPSSSIRTATLLLNSSGNLICVANHVGNGYNLVFTFDTSGTLLSQYDVPNYTSTTYVGIDSSDNIYMGGRYSTNNQVAVTKVNSSGVVQWTNLSQVLSSSSFGVSFISDSSGNSYLINSVPSPTNITYITKFNSSGVKQWERSVTLASGIIGGYNCDNMGNIYAGLNYGTSGSNYYSRYLRFTDNGTKTGTYTVGDDVVIASSSAMTWTNPTISSATPSFTSSTSSFSSQADSVTVSTSSLSSSIVALT